MSRIYCGKCARCGTIVVVKHPITDGSSVPHSKYEHNSAVLDASTEFAAGFDNGEAPELELARMTPVGACSGPVVAFGDRTAEEIRGIVATYKSN